MLRQPQRIDRKQAVLIVVDVQERFRDLIDGMPDVIRNSARLISFCDRLDVPILASEQYPHGLGRTVSELRELLGPVDPLEKLSFSCAGDTRFVGKLRGLGRSQFILCGIEAHVCVYQTAFDLLGMGWQVAVAADAVSSRLPSNREHGLAQMRDLGARIMSTEMLMFEMLRAAGTPEFKRVADLLKG